VEAGGWGLDARLGAAWNVPVRTRIHQEGSPELEFTGRWDTRAFRFPLYYGARARTWDARGGWSVDLVHHKLHLVDPPPEVNRFAISHGYNLVTLQRLFPAGAWTGGLGAGWVVAHPENQVRGAPLDESGGLFGSGYHLAGPTVAASLATSAGAGAGPYGVAEVRLTFSWARVPVGGGGDATVPNLAAHLMAGAGWRAR
jgi:hypothetical protein